MPGIAFTTCAVGVVIFTGAFTLNSTRLVERFPRGVFTTTMYQPSCSAMDTLSITYVPEFAFATTFAERAFPWIHW